MNKNFRRSVLASLLACSILFTGCETGEDKKGNQHVNKENQYTSYATVNNLESGIAWPDGQVIPTFATPAEQMDTLNISYFKTEERLTVTALQGIVNKTQPRLLILDENPDEGMKTWPQTENMGFEMVSYKRAERFEVLKKYIGEVDGVVLYDQKKSDHYRNLANTVAGLQNLLPMSQIVYETFKENGMELEVKVDLTTLEYDNAVDIYNYLYDTYWKDCNHRLLISASPNDCQHVRDMGTAAGSAIVYLDCTNSEEKAVFEKFLADMTPGNGLVMGWYTTERSGITTVTSYGLSTVPADLYQNSTVYAGTDHAIQIPEVPDKPELENKMYVALYISDGDNIQYNQRYMRKLWDQTVNDRGQTAINWTISPALVDAGPALLNYYYTTATEKDYFVVGPSGLGYSMPVNTLEENGAPAIDFLEGKDELFTPFVKLTDTYLQRSGLRVVTIWDNLSPSQRQIYTANARHLYGLTVHDWHLGDSAASSVENDMLVQQLKPCYGGAIGDFSNQLKNALEDWDGASPAFFAGQLSVWGSAKPTDINKMVADLEEDYPGQIEFVRADHYYALYNEANNMAFDLSMSSKVTATATSQSDKAALTIDGTPAGESIWVADAAGEQTVTYNLGGTYKISRYVIRHAGDNGLDATLNTKNYLVEVSADGETWTTVDDYRDNTANVTDIDLTEPVEASYLRIVIQNPGADNIARIADVEIYGAVK